MKNIKLDSVIQKGNKKDVVLLREKICVDKTEKITVPYETLTKHIEMIDESIARLQVERVEYEELIAEIDAK